MELWPASPPFSVNALKLEEPGDVHGTWGDNFLFVPEEDAAHWRWGWAGPVAGMRCTLMNEPGDMNQGETTLCAIGTSDGKPRPPSVRRRGALARAAHAAQGRLEDQPPSTV